MHRNWAHCLALPSDPYRGRGHCCRPRFHFAQHSPDAEVNWCSKPPDAPDPDHRGDRSCRKAPSQRLPQDPGHGMPHCDRNRYRFVVHKFYAKGYWYSHSTQPDGRNPHRPDDRMCRMVPIPQPLPDWFRDNTSKHSLSSHAFGRSCRVKDRQRFPRAFPVSVPNQRDDRSFGSPNDSPYRPLLQCHP